MADKPKGKIDWRKRAKQKYQSCKTKIGQRYSASKECCNKAKGYLKNPENFIKVATLSFVAIYTVITGLMWYDNRSSQERQLRAYVGTSLVDPGDDGKHTSLLVMPNGKWVFIIRARNTGITPAYQAVFASYYAIDKYPLDKTFDFSKGDPALGSRKDGDTPNPVTMQPGVFESPILAVINSDTAALAVDEASGMDGKRLYVFGTLRYIDAFNRAHKTNFCYGIYNIHIPGFATSECNIHNDAT